MAETDNPIPNGGHEKAPRAEGPTGGSAPELSADALPEPEEPRPPRAEYEIMPSQREEPESGYMAEHYHPVIVAGDAGAKGNAVRARLAEGSVEKINKLGNSQTRIYAAIGIGMGLVVGLTAAVVLIRPRGAGGPNEMGAVAAAQYGLEGHLSTNWKDNRLTYQLTIEPDSEAHRAGFLANVSSSPRPLTVTVQAKDPFGAALCSDTILLKFDPRNEPAVAGNGPAPKSEKAAQELAAQNQISREINLARREADELDRERGKNLFQNDVGPDGQITSISAQGMLPCEKKDVERFVSWGFTSDFPIVAQPAVIPDGPYDPKANVNTAAIEAEARQKAAAERAAAAEAAKGKKKPPPPPLTPIFVEGDDQIVWVDPSGGVVETSGGKALILDKGDKLGATLKGRDLPIAIHYRCNEATGCTFSTVELGMHHARLRK